MDDLRTDIRARDGGHPDLHNEERARLNALSQLAGRVTDVVLNGADPTGTQDSTASIQDALNQGGAILVPTGVYLINALAAPRFVSDSVLWCMPSAIFRIIPNASSSYVGLRITDVSNVRIAGLTLVGDRYEHQGDEGASGHGIIISGGTNITLDRCDISAMWGDGVYVTRQSQRIQINNCAIHHVRRNGLSVASARIISAFQSAFTDIEGTPPQAGVDLEPNAGDSIQDARFIDCVFSRSRSGWASNGTKGPVEDVLLLGCVFDGNSVVGAYSKNVDRLQIVGCCARDNLEWDYSLSESRDVQIVASTGAVYPDRPA